MFVVLGFQMMASVVFPVDTTAFAHHLFLHFPFVPKIVILSILLLIHTYYK